MTLQDLQMQFLPKFEAKLGNFLENELILSEQLNLAIKYSTLNAGKRLRPLLIYATLDGFKCDFKKGDFAAMAVEFIHCYSLIHDDLPALDDDDLRRNKPSCHKKFDECTAILAGDALQTLAFEVLTKSQSALDLIKILTKAVGANGMIGGQMLDMQSSADDSLSDEMIKLIHKNKTGALIQACVIMAGILAQANTDELTNLEQIADNLGLAFQIQDDILDITSTTEELGKKVAADLEHNKASFVNVFGLEKAKEQVQKLLQDSLLLINKLQAPNRDFTALKQLALYIIKRKK